MHRCGNGQNEIIVGSYANKPRESEVNSAFLSTPPNQIPKLCDLYDDDFADNMFQVQDLCEPCERYPAGDNELVHATIHVTVIASMSRELI